MIKHSYSKTDVNEKVSGVRNSDLKINRSPSSNSFNRSFKNTSFGAKDGKKSAESNKVVQMQGT